MDILSVHGNNSFFSDFLVPLCVHFRCAKLVCIRSILSRPGFCCDLTLLRCLPRRSTCVISFTVWRSTSIPIPHQAIPPVGGNLLAPFYRSQTFVRFIASFSFVIASIALFHALPGAFLSSSPSLISFSPSGQCQPGEERSWLGLTDGSLESSSSIREDLSS